MRKRIKTTTDIIDEKGFTCTSPIFHDSIRQSCYGDRMNHILVNFDRKLYFCTARDFTDDNSVGMLNLDGSLSFKETALKRWRKAKFDKEVCHICRIAPICGGGCRQKNIETSGSDFCVRNYSEEDKDKVVIDRFESYIISTSNSNILTSDK